MRKLLKLFVVSAAMLLSVSALAVDTAYAYISGSAGNKTLSFARSNIIPFGCIELESGDAPRGGDDYPVWHAQASEIVKVVFDASFSAESLNRCDKWFAGFTNLETIEGVANLNTANVTQMQEMFFGCAKLTELDISTFNTANVTDMTAMFSGCTGLKVLNLRNFDMANVDEMGEMFYNCSSLRRIIGPMVNIKTTGSVESADMFTGCTSLVGGFGTEYDPKCVGKEYACVDADGTPGYLSYRAIVYYDDTAKKLTFYNDNAEHPLLGGNALYLVADAEVIDSFLDYVEWFEKCSSVTKIVFDSTFANYKPLQCGAWFFGYGNLTEISNLKNLDTSMAKDFAYMFEGCGKLTSIDVSGFDTANATSMREMFLECSKLTELDLSSFDTDYVTDMRMMFKDCTDLKKIYVGVDFVTHEETNDGEMFYGCNNLVGEKGTAYSAVTDAEKKGKKYAHIDRHPSDPTPGYFSAVPVAVLSTDGKTLTFYADGDLHKGEGQAVYSVLEASNGSPSAMPPWYAGCHNSVETVEFDESFANFRPKHCANWFYDFGLLKDVFGMRYLDTSAATDMRYMFAECKSLDELDLSRLDMANVTSMSGMFSNCESLKSLDLSSFNTAKVTDMSYMFDGCTALESISLIGVDTSKVTTMYHMFKNCSSLTELNLSSFDTAKVDDMTGMFTGCSELVTIYAPNFTLKSGVESQPIFGGCTELKGDSGTIYDAGSITALYARKDGGVGNEGYFTKPMEAKAVLEDAGETLRFVYDNANYGVKGTAWFSVADAEKLDPSANMPWNAAAGTVTKVLFDESFYVYAPKHCGSWFSDFTSLTEVEGTECLNLTRATSLAYMFFNCAKLKGVTLDCLGGGKVTSMYQMFQDCAAIESVSLYLDTASLTSMQSMFNNCAALEYFDYELDTSKVTTMQSMFLGCEALESLDLGGFDTSSVTDMRHMFGGCKKLTGLNLGSFDTRKVTAMKAMFSECSALKSLDLTSFETAAVTLMLDMFNNCKDIERIYASPAFVTTAIADPATMSMFSGCTKLRGGKGTTYADVSNYSAAYAKLDGGESDRGFFTRPPVVVLSSDGTRLTFYNDGSDHAAEGTVWSVASVRDRWNVPTWNCECGKSNVTKAVFDPSFVTFKPAHCGCWFYEFTALTEIEGLQYLDVSEATSFYCMFDGCSALKSLDLSTFNTAKVKGMTSMFGQCTELRRIYTSESFVTTGLTGSGSGDGVFACCYELVGGNDTAYDDSVRDSTYARIDAPGMPGYFTKAGPRTVTLDAQGGVVTPATLTPTVDTAVGSLPTPTRAGYTFDGWFTAATDGDAVSEMTLVTKDVTFHAHWTVQTYTISYTLNGGTNASGNPTSYTVESAAITLSAPTREGYAFKGWTPSGAIAAGSTGSKTFTASWNVLKFDVDIDGAVSNGCHWGQIVTATAPVANVTNGWTNVVCIGWIGTGDVPATGDGTETTFTVTQASSLKWLYETNYLRWAVVYELNGGVNDESNPDTYTIADAVTLAAPTREGYTFKGWTPFGAIAKGSWGDKTFTATWEQNGGDTPSPGPEPDKVAVAFDANGGTVGETSRQVAQGTAIGALPTPIRSGFAFKGWFTASEGGDPVGAGEIVVDALTCYAHWESVAVGKKVVTFNAGNGSVGELSCQVAEGSPVGTLPTPTRTGYEFKGWFDQLVGGTPITADTIVDANFTAYAAWQVIEYPIAVDLAGGTLVTSAPSSYTVEDAVTLAAPTREGYDFAGWTPDNGKIAIGSTGDKSFAANWAPVEYAIAYELNGGVNAAGNPNSYTVESAAITLSAPTREGYAFKGWTPSGAIAKGSWGDKTFTATWERNGGDTPPPGPEPDKVAVTFDANGGTVGETARQVAQGTAIGALPTPIRAGFAFMGWYDGAAGGEQIFAEKVLFDSLTCYAHWETAAVGKKVVTFDAVNGTVGEATRQITAGNPVGTLPTPTRTGYEFKGWFDQLVGGTPITADTIVDANFTAYAAWQVVEYPIAVDLAGGTLTTRVPSSYTVEDTITLGTPTRDRHQFTGWTPDDGVIQKGTTGARSFLAQWMRVYPSLFNDSEGGSVNPKGTTYNGFLGGNDDLGGTFTLVTKKAKNGIADATLTLIDANTGKKKTIKGKVDVESGEMSGELAGLDLSAKSIGGTLLDANVQGVVDASKSKDKDALAVMNAFNGLNYAFVLEDVEGSRAMLTVAFSSKGKAKVSGTAAGAKVSGSAQMSVGAAVCAVPFAYAKKDVSVTFVLWFDKSTKALVDVSGLGAGVDLVACGAAEAPATGECRFAMAADDLFASVPDAIDETPLAVAMSWNGKKFDAGKTAKVSYKKGELTVDTSKGDNVSGLSLKYSKGALSGSFTIYALTNGKLVKNKFTVSGILVDGIGYATATNKKLVPIPVSLER